jgi:hypothetical protein
MEDVRVCPGADGDVLILWRRKVDMERVWWDSELHRWRTDLANQPPDDQDPAEPPPLEIEEGFYPPDRDLLSRDKLVGARIIKGDAARRFMLPDVGSAWSCDDMLLGPVVCQGDHWEVALGVYPAHPQGQEDTSSKKLQLVPVSWQGWGTLVPVSGSEGIFAPLMAMDAHADELHVFLQSTFLPFGPFTFPDSGLETSQLACIRIAGNRIVGEKTVYTTPLRRHDMDHQMLSMPGGRYDLVFRRSGAQQDDPDELVHVADLLGRWPKTSTAARLANLDFRFAAVARQGESVQVAYLEQLRGVGRVPTVRGRLFEVHQRDGRWTGPRVLFLGDIGGYKSLAAATAKSGDQELVVVVWRGLDGNLVYCLSPDADTWTRPQATQLALGSTNWLVFAGDAMVLVSEFHNNLYWCRIGLVRARPPATQAVNRPPVAPAAAN